MDDSQRSIYYYLVSKDFVVEPNDIKIGVDFQGLVKYYHRLPDYFIINSIEVNLLEEESLVPTSLTTTSESKSIIVASIRAEMKCSPRYFTYIFPIPSEAISMNEFILQQYELLMQPPIQRSMKVILQLVDAVKALHERSTPSFLVDLNDVSSIWVLQQLSGEIQVRVLAKERQNPIALDKDLIYESYLEQLRGNCVSLYPPEMLEAAVDLKDKVPVVRTHVADSWAIGQIMLQILRCDIDKPDQVTQLRYNDSNSKQLMVELCKGMFEKDPSKRISLESIREYILKILERESKSDKDVEDVEIEIPMKVKSGEDDSMEEEEEEEGEGHKVKMNCERISIREYLDIRIQNYHSDTSILPEIVYHAACDVLKDKVRADKQNRNWTLMLSRVFFLRQMYKKARHQYGRILELDASDEDANYECGLLEFQQGNFLEARKYFEACNKSNESRVDALFWIGSTFHRTKQFQEASTQFELYCQSDYQNPKVLEALSLSYAERNDKKMDALMVLGEIAKLRKVYEQKRDRLKVEFYSEKLKESTDEIEKLKASASYTHYRDNGIEMFELGDYMNAMKQFRASIGKEVKQNLRSLLGIAECQIKLKNMKEANSQFDELIKYFNDATYAKTREMEVKVYELYADLQVERANIQKAIFGFQQCFACMDRKKDSQYYEIAAKYLSFIKSVCDQQLKKHKYFMVQRRKICCDDLEADVDFEDQILREISTTQRFKYTKNPWIVSGQLQNVYAQELLNANPILVIRGQLVIETLAFNFVSQENYQRAVSLFKICEGFEPKSENAAFDLLTATTANELSQSWPRNTREECLRNWDFLVNLQKYKEGRTVDLTKKDRKALDTSGYLKMAALKGKEIPNASFNLALIQQFKDDSWNYREQLIKSALKIDDKNPDYIFGFAEILFERKKFGVMEFQKSLEDCFSHDVNHLLALNLQLQLPDKDIIDKEQVLVQQHEASCMHAAMISILLGKYEEADRYWQECAQCNPMNPTVQILAKCGNHTIREKFKEFHEAMKFKFEVVQFDEIRKEFHRSLGEVVSLGVNVKSDIGHSDFDGEREIESNIVAFVKRNPLLSHYFQEGTLFSAVRYFEEELIAEKDTKEEKEKEKEKDSTSSKKSEVLDAEGVMSSSPDVVGEKKSFDQDVIRLVYARLLFINRQFDLVRLKRVQGFFSSIDAEKHSFRFNFALTYAKSMIASNLNSIKSIKFYALKDAIQEYEFLSKVIKSTDHKRLEQQRLAAFALADVLVTVSEVKQAQEFFQSAVEISPSLDEAQQVLGFLIRLRETNEMHEFDEIFEEVLPIASKLHARSPTAPLLTGCLLEQFGHTPCHGFCSYRKSKAMLAKKTESANLKAMRNSLTSLAMNNNFVPFLQQKLEILIAMNNYTNAAEMIKEFKSQNLHRIALVFEGILESKKQNNIKSLDSLFQFAYMINLSESDANELLSKKEVTITWRMKSTESDLLQGMFDSKYISGLTWRVIDEIAWVYEKLNLKKELVNLYGQCMRLNPKKEVYSIRYAGVLFECTSSELEGFELIQKILLAGFHRTSTSSISREIQDELFLIGCALKEKEYLREAVVAFKHCVAFDSMHGSAFSLIGDCLLALNESDTGIVESYYRKQLKVNKNNIGTYIALGNLLSKSGNEVGATKVFQNALECQESSEKRFFYEQVVSIMEKLESKQKMLLHILQNFAKDFPEEKARCQLKTARIHWLRIKDFPEAIQQYRYYLGMVIVDSQESIEAYFIIGKIHFGLGEFNQAESNFARANSISQTLYGTPMQEALVYLAKVCIKLNKFEEAEKYTFMNLSKYRTHALVLESHAYTLLKQKKYEDSLKYYEDCMHYSQGGMPEILESLGKVYSKLNMLEEAKVLYKASIDAIPNRSEIIIKYAKVLNRLGEYPETLLILGTNWKCVGDADIAKKEFYLGEAHLALRQFDLAKKQFEAVGAARQQLFKYSARSCQRLLYYSINNGETKLFKDKLNVIMTQSKNPLKEQKELARVQMMRALVLAADGNFILSKQAVNQSLAYSKDFEHEFMVCYAQYQLKIKNSPLLALECIQRIPESSPFRKTMEWRLCEAEMMIESKDFSQVSLLESIDPDEHEGWVSTQIKYLLGLYHFNSVQGKQKVDLEVKEHLTKMRELIEGQTCHPQSILKTSEMFRVTGCYDERRFNFLKESKVTFCDNLFILLECAKVASSDEIKRYSESAQFFEQYLTYNDSDISVYNSLGNAYLNCGKAEQAQQVIELVEKKFTTTVSLDILLLSARVANLLSHELDAIKHASQYISQAPSDVNGYLVLGEAYSNLREIGKQRTTYEEALVNCKDFKVELFHNLGEVYAKESNLEGLKRIIPRLISLEIPVNVQVDLGNWMCDIGDYSKANEFALKQLETHINDAKLTEVRLLALINLDDWMEIEQVLKDGVLLKITNPVVLLPIAKYFNAKKKYLSSIEWVSRINPKSHVDVLEMHILIACNSFRIRKFDNAQLHVKSCLKKINSHSPKELLHRLWFIRGMIGFAGYNTNLRMSNSVGSMSQIDVFKELICVKGRNLELLALLSYAYLEANQLREAENILDEVDVLEKARTERSDYGLSLKVLIDIKKYECSSTIEIKEAERILELDRIAIEKYLSEEKEEDADSQVQEQLMYAYGKVLSILKQFENAVSIINRCLLIETRTLLSDYCVPLSRQKSNEIRFLKLKALIELGRSEDSVSASNELRVESSLTDEITLSLATMSFERGDYSESMQLLEKYVFRPNVDVKFLLLVAKVKHAKGQVDQAIQMVERCLFIAPKNHEAIVLYAAMRESNQNPYEAVEELRVARNLDGKNVEILLKLLRVLFKLKFSVEFDEVLKDYSALIPNLNPEVVVLSALRAYQKNEFEAANQIIEDGLKNFPENVDILVGLAKIYHSQGNCSKKIEVYHRILAIPSLSESSKKKIKERLASSYLMVGRFNDAQEMYLSFKSIEDCCEPEHLFNLALCALVENKYDSALSLLKRAYSIERNEPRTMYLLGYVYSKMHELQAGILWYKRCLEEAPDFLQATINLSILFRRTKNFREAELTLVEAMKIYPKNLTITYHIALTYLAKSSPSQALHVLREAVHEFAERSSVTVQKSNETREFLTNFYATVKRSEEVADAGKSEQKKYMMFKGAKAQLLYLIDLRDSICGYSTKNGVVDIVQLNLLMALCMRKCKQAEEAVRHLAMCLESDPDNVAYSFGLAQSHFSNGKVEHCAYEINRCRKLDVENAAIYAFSLAGMYRKSKQFKEEIRALSVSLEDDPMFYEAVIALGCAYYEQDMFVEAVDMFSKAIELRPEDSNAHFNIGNAYLCRREFSQAILAYERCMRLTPNHDECWFNLGKAYWLGNEFKKAVNCFEKCVQNDPINSQQALKNLSVLHKKILLHSS